MAKLKKLNSGRKNDNSQEDCDLESLQDDVESLWLEIKDEMGEYDE